MNNTRPFSFLIPAALLWCLARIVVTTYHWPLEEKLWFLSSIVSGIIWCAGLALFVFAAVRSRKQHVHLLACLALLVSSWVAIRYHDDLAIDLRFSIAQSHYEKRLAEVLASPNEEAEDVARIEGPQGRERVAFYWYRGVTDNWIGLVHDPSDTLNNPELKKGQRAWFGGEMTSARHLKGHWYLCRFT